MKRVCLRKQAEPLSVNLYEIVQVKSQGHTMMEPKTEATQLFQEEFPFGQMCRGKAMTMEAITCKGKAWQRRLVHTEVKQMHQWP